MKLALAASLLATTTAFTSITNVPKFGMSCPTQLFGMYEGDTLEAALERELDYKPGVAKGELAQRFGHLVGTEVRTVGEAFADFTKILGCSINALYKNMVTDIVGSTHLIVVDARFKRDSVWSLGLLSALDMLLKNYPEKEISTKIVSSMMQALGLDEAAIRAEAKAVEDYVQGKSPQEIEKELASGDASSLLGQIAATAKADNYWMYSRFFGLGLVKIGEIVGVEQTMDDSSTSIEKWMTSMGKPTFTAMADSDQWFRVKAKLDMMETLMKEIEIREKKRMADRLEQKAEMALQKAEKEAKLEAEFSDSK